MKKKFFEKLKLFPPKVNPISKKDYSFGSSEITHIRQNLLNKKFGIAESLISKLSSDTITYALDCITLNLDEKVLLNWHEKTRGSEISKLSLGIFYAHKGWDTRGNALASEVNEKNILSFAGYQIEAAKIIENIDSDNSIIQAEACSRLVRIYMSIGDTENEDQAFQTGLKSDPDKVWLYIHRLESVQPKWGGSIQKLNQFLEQIPENKTIKRIVDLKLVMDSLAIGENYFESEAISVEEKINQTINSIDSQLNNTKTSSLHDYIVYGYMTKLAYQVNNEEMADIYFKKMNNNFTLYPFGILK